MARRSMRDADGVFYFPFDFAFVVRRVLDVVRPRLFVMIETRDLAEPAARVPARAA